MDIVQDRQVNLTLLSQKLENFYLDKIEKIKYNSIMLCKTCHQNIHLKCDWNQGRCPHAAPLIDIEKLKMNIQPKDTSRRHFWASMIKSITRLGACAALYTGDYATAAVMFFAAELLGIAEELV